MPAEAAATAFMYGSECAHVLVDAGISGRRIEKGLNSLELTGRDIDGILITHEHSDHIKGLGVLARKYGIPIYTTGGTADALSRSKSLGELPEGIFREIREDEPFLYQGSFHPPVYHFP